MSRTEETYTLAVGQMQDIFGEGDHYLKKIEKQFHVDVFDRSGTLHVAGEARDVARAGAVIRQLAGLSAHAGSIDIQNVEYAIALSGEKQPMDAEKDNLLTDLDTDVICHTTNGKPVKPKTLGQK